MVVYRKGRHQSNDRGFMISETFVPNKEIVVAGRKFKLKKFSIGVICQLEQTYGSYEEIFSKLTQKPSLSLFTHILYEMLGIEGKSEFDSLQAFRDSMDFDDFAGMQTVLLDVINKSLPEVGKETKGKKK